MKKIIFYVFGYKYNEIYKNRYQIQHLSKDFDIHVIDLSKIFSPFLKKKIKRLKNHRNIFVINKLKDFNKLLSRKLPNFAVLDGDENFQKKIERIVRQYSVSTKIIEFHNSTLPDHVPFYNLYATKRIIFNIFAIRFFPKLLTQICKIIYLYFKKLIFDEKEKKQKIDILFYAGKSTLFRKDIKKKFIEKKISSPSFDYDKFLQVKNVQKKKFYNKNYVVFLDQMAFHHDDFKSPDLHNAPVSEKYFKEMSNFFSIFEKKFNTEILIALHPACHIKNYHKFFDYRKCFKNKTIELVRDSSMVLLHPSTSSVSYPIIFKKPITYLTTDEMINSYTFYKALLVRQKIFGGNFLNISKIKNENFSLKFKINKKAYNFYYSNFINSCKSSEKKKNLYKTILRNLK